MDQKKQPAIFRRPLINKLVSHFCREYKEVMMHYPAEMQAELTEHLIILMEKLLDFTGMDEESGNAIYQQVYLAEMTLLKKYRKLLHPYWQKKFTDYFVLAMVLPLKDMFSTQQYNVLPEEQQVFYPAEAAVFAQSCIDVLHTQLSAALLLTSPENTNGPGSGAENAQPANGNDFTRSRQLLAIHFLLSAGFGLEPHSGADISSIARLGHLLTGTPYTSLQNSEIYKKYLRIPNIKSGLPYITDLQYIRGYFTELGLQKVIEAIDLEINREQKEKSIPRNRKS